MIGECVQEFAIGHVPQPQRPIDAAGKRESAVRGDCEASNPARMALELASLVHGVGVAEANRAVRAGKEKLLAVGQECNAADSSPLSDTRSHLAATLHVPQTYYRVRAGG